MQQTRIANKKDILSTIHRSKVTAADSGNISASTGVVQVGESISMAVHARFSSNTANANISLALFDQAGSFIGLTTNNYFSATSLTNTSYMNIAARYIYDIGEASQVKAIVETLNGGNVDIYLQGL